MNKSALSKLATLALAIGLAFGGSIGVVWDNIPTVTGARSFNQGYEFCTVELENIQATPNSTLTFRVNNVLGMSRIGIDYLDNREDGGCVATGNVTTLNVNPLMFTSKSTSISAFILTEGTDRTDLDSENFLFTYQNNLASTTNFYLKLNIAD